MKRFGFIPIAVLAVAASVALFLSAAPGGAEDKPKSKDPAACEASSHCAGPQTAKATLSQKQLGVIADWVVARLLEGGSPQIGREEILEATGIHVTQRDTPAITQAVVLKLSQTPEGRELAASSPCADYGACSVDGDLATAKGETLDMYFREKSQDGVVLEDATMPSFEALDLEGNRVSTDDLVDQPTLLVMVAAHCGHSIGSFPILNDLDGRFREKGLRVVAVVVNSGDPEQVREWIAVHEPSYEVWVHSDASLGDAVKNHLVPTYFLVDAKGQLQSKLIGFKTLDQAVEDVEKLVDKS